ncbi:MAG: GNAT family N-acetyltransferase [Planctomycetota bacterium]
MDPFAPLLDSAIREHEADPAASPSLPLAASAGGGETVFDWHNRRVKCLGLRSEATDPVWLAATCQALLDAPTPFSKLTCYVRDAQREPWTAAGMVHEATITGFYGEADCQIWARFLDPERATDHEAENLDAIVATAEERGPKEAPLAEGYSVRTATSDDGPLLAEILAATFCDYPTPIAPDHQTMLITSGRSHFEIATGPDGSVAAVISAELDRENGNAEVSDCATLSAHRGRGLMRHLIRRVEDRVAADHGIRSFYTLARACEPGMNIAFARCGYIYTGRLVNNCRMPEGWESMNAWCKRHDG